MDRDRIKQIVIDALGQFLISLGQAVPEITDKTDPINELGLHTEDGVDWICGIEVYGFDIPLDVNPFRFELDTSRWAFRPRLVGEIVDLLQGYARDEGH